MKKKNAFKPAGSLVLFFLATLVAQSALSTPTEGDVPLDDFADASLEGWSERSFEGNTHYELVEEDGVMVLKGHTRQQASILYKTKEIDLNETPVVNWSWKVDRTYVDINELAREGDDFPARLYVVAKVGFLPWETLAINYVWASELPVGETWSNPFTDKAKMVAVQSGNDHVGQWTSHSRNIAEDFENLFGQTIDEIDGYAVMVDGDNSQAEAIAWFAQIDFTAN